MCGCCRRHDSCYRRHDSCNVYGSEECSSVVRTLCVGAVGDMTHAIGDMTQ